ncbi:MAG: hypothetical protein A4E44_00082 [Methanosaeta sp. PtaB.Bin018]|jgi:hypothetical protein|nr:hypothetical protein [Methanothrix sp.]OPX77382.1 MAG: hypothetical protein A4E44_00082 [Methanosaeta sp. PtaB.Bin018]
MKASKKVIYDGVIGWVRPYLKGGAIGPIDSDSKGLKKASSPKSMALELSLFQARKMGETIKY